jgi:uncharacterized membrane protein
MDNNIEKNIFMFDYPLYRKDNELDDFDLIFLNKYWIFFNHKTLLLPVAIILPLMNFNIIYNNDFYIIFSCFISLLILTWNFPYLSKFSYSKPIYFEDLNDDNNYKIRKKILYNIGLSKKFKKRFIIFQQFLLSITFTIVVEYISIKYKNKDYQPMEFFGLIGGIFSLYMKIIKYIGNFVLIILYKMKTKEKENILKKINSQNYINMNELEI